MKEHIEYLLTLNPVLPPDTYRQEVVRTLTPPKWYYPLKRRQFYLTLDTRIGLVMSEYAKDVINALGGNTQTNTTNTNQLDPRTTPAAPAPKRTVTPPTA